MAGTATPSDESLWHPAHYPPPVMDSLPPRTSPTPPSARTRVRRGRDRARYDRAEVLEILDAGVLAHVGVSTPDGPLVLPMAYGRDDEALYLHGAIANHILNSGDDQEICVTVTHLDGLVIARSPFHNSMNYRSVVVRGRGRRIRDDRRKFEALRLITDHVVPHWDIVRPPSGSELRKTLVLELPLAEASAKVRTGDPVDDLEDILGPWWAGTVPITTRFGRPTPSADLESDLSIPEPLTALTELTLDERPRPHRG